MLSPIFIHHQTLTNNKKKQATIEAKHSVDIQKNNIVENSLLLLSIKQSKSKKKKDRSSSSRAVRRIKR
jgi:hypothetical protein